MSETQDGCGVFGTEDQGKASKCEGCPNASNCRSGEGGVDPDIVEITTRFATIDHIVLVLSGKGGVGKSTVASQMAFALSEAGHRVGLLDVDICGPSVPTLTGTQAEEVHQSADGLEPVQVNDNLCVMSIGYLLPNQDDFIAWRGPRKNSMIKTFLNGVAWGALDYLIVDTPPGTSDEHISTINYLSGPKVDGVVVVSTPQEVALADVRKEINFCHQVNLPVLGVVENMSGMVCPKCNEETTVFHPSSGGCEAMAKAMNVPFLGRLPLDLNAMRACDAGQSWRDAGVSEVVRDRMWKVIEGSVLKLKD